MSFSATIEADSVSPDGTRLTTMVVTLPRMMLPELNTHRAFSRNSASSRAIPVKTQLERIEADPFLPVHWGRNQGGMQAAEELSGTDLELAVAEWRAAKDDSVGHVQRLLAIGLHKQVANRLLEPYMWHTVVITATEWDNFFALRVNPQAQPEIRQAAELMLAAWQNSVPLELREGQWHVPFIQDDERDGTWEHTPEAACISAARCARVSYLTHDGKRDHAADLTLYERLVTSGHMSPLEHVATPFTSAELKVRAAMARRARQIGDVLSLSEHEIEQLVEGTAFKGNFRGWTQLRKTMPGEENFALFAAQE